MSFFRLGVTMFKKNRLACSTYCSACPIKSPQGYLIRVECEAYSSGVSRKENIFFLCDLCALSEVYPVECLYFSIQLRRAVKKYLTGILKACLLRQP
jgi:hypothetical protein